MTTTLNGTKPLLNTGTHLLSPDFVREDDALLNELRDISEKCWKHFNLRGYARIDFRVDKQGKPWVLEINANPCINPDDKRRVLRNR